MIPIFIQEEIHLTKTVQSIRLHGILLFFKQTQSPKSLYVSFLLVQPAPQFA